ncbi:MAG: rRNA maturation RNase YbeY [Bacteroidota bacterium]
MPTAIEIRNLSGRDVDLCSLQEAALRTLAAEGADLEVLSLALVDDERITSLNARLLGRDNPTDVIAFEADEGEGEVIISVDTATQQAAAEGHPVLTELRYLVAHGVLHVLGHDDSDDEAKQNMLRRQDEILAHE